MGRDTICKIYNFKCPRWEDLPEKPIFNQEVVTYVNDLFKDFLPENQLLTTTMVQNYIKLGHLPRPNGRKYNRTRIAYLICITLFKQILTIREISKGVELQMKLMSKDEAYDTFAIAIEKAFYHTFKPMCEEGQFRVLEFSAEPDEAGMQMIANSLALKLLGTLILEEEGFERLSLN